MEILKRGIDAFNRRDLDAFFDLATPDFELIPAMPVAVEGNSYRGREGMERYFEMVSGTWDEFRVVREEFRDLDDRVLLTFRLEARGRGSGAPVSARQMAICEFRTGKISLVQTYLEHGEATRAAGLSD